MNIKESGLILFVENYPAALDFYTHQLGLPVREQQPELTVFQFGNSYLMVEKGGAASPAAKSRSQNPTVLRLDVEDFEQTVQELRNRHVTIEVSTHSWGIIGILLDPDGNRIEIKKHGISSL
ncbi:VOC family protein [Paenibacillus glycanilyticus]|uniref:VOC family protein n=1 Tax=Paenibacillus glycanilyticus TaxID=126569 RepID=UPI00203FB764|nr:VOC family protein [Paenibacillus glycanilyticus]MCM3628570.1 VOC family protein [Paenibacillus glycanilyticus]